MGTDSGGARMAASSLTLSRLRVLLENVSTEVAVKLPSSMVYEGNGGTGLVWGSWRGFCVLT
jgi:hypothetical protein